MAASNTITKSRFHATDEKYVEYSRNIIINGLKEGLITQDDASLIQEFVNEIRATAQICPQRAFKITCHMANIREFIGPYRNNTVADVYQGIDNIRMAKKPSGQQRFKQNTVGDIVRFVKRFYLWMGENGYTSIDEKKITKIRPPSYDTMTKTAKQMLDETEVKAMLTTCRISRDRAIIAMLYEGGFRIGELGALKWEQVKFNDWNVVINVNEKTGKPRFIPLVMARSYLAQWRNDYPFPVTDDGYVFLTNNEHEPLQYRGVAKQLSIIARRAGIQKHITPHIFRHSRITHLIQQGYNESIIKKMMWGNLTTNMFRTYAHLTDEDIENEIAEKNGIITKARREKSECLEPRQCSRCFTVNAPTVQFCGQCGLP